jgi:PadR family transcriptional regulator, regulatory protein PadR
VSTYSGIGEAVADRSEEGKLVQRRAFLRSWLLLLVAESPGHGYELADRLNQWGFDLPGPRPVYRELRALEESGLAQTIWAAPQSGPAPRVYALTERGRAALDQAAQELSDMEELLQGFRRRYEGLGGR